MATDQPDIVDEVGNAHSADARVGVRGGCHKRDGDCKFHKRDRNRRQHHVEDGELIGIVGQMLPHWVWRWLTDADNGEGVRCPNRHVLGYQCRHFLLLS